jgi:hypothetical protein
LNGYRRRKYLRHRVGYDNCLLRRLQATSNLLGKLRLSALPFVPLVAWPVEEWRWLGIGLGDLLLAAVFPLVTRKAFGPAAGRAALAISVCAIGCVLALPILGITYVAFPLMIAQYTYWCRRGAERTSMEYRRLEPFRSSSR